MIKNRTIWERMDAEFAAVIAHLDAFTDTSVNVSPVKGYVPPREQKITPPITIREAAIVNGFNPFDFGGK